MAELTPFALKDAPALIEAVFPAQKVSIEAQRERKAGSSQTLTSLGSYWKGRKPLILVKAVALGCLLPQTDDLEKDLEIYELLLNFDDASLAKRALKKSAMAPNDILSLIDEENPWQYFDHGISPGNELFSNIIEMKAPFSFSELGINSRWSRSISDEMKLNVYAKLICKLNTYEQKSSICKRPEELNQDWLCNHIWPKVNKHYERYGVKAYSFGQLIEQFGLLRFGRRPSVGDTFAGGGSIPFEASRLGFDTYASDLNPIACLLNWGNLNVIRSNSLDREKIGNHEVEVCKKVDEKLNALGFEYDSIGNRAKAYLYCLETKCPETGWQIPLAPNWTISKKRKVVAVLVPNYQQKKFDIEIRAGANKEEMQAASIGTVVKNHMVYTLDGKRYSTPIRSIRGDRKTNGQETINDLRLWDKLDIEPIFTDIFKERLYCIQWVAKETLESGRYKTFFSSVTQEDIVRERLVADYVRAHLIEWQSSGFCPENVIETGKENEGLIRTMGWTHWHHLFNPRQLLILALLKKFSSPNIPAFQLNIARMADRLARNNRWDPSGEKSQSSFDNQAMTTGFNYSCRGWLYCENLVKASLPVVAPIGDVEIENSPASEVKRQIDFWITDPPYADAVHYHEITEFFIAWLRKNPPKPFDEWVWDSRRALAVKGNGDDFRKGMVDSYSEMTKKMTGNGMQCVMFTHQDTGVWADMIGIFWASGLQVVGAWYIATETTSELKKGGYVQGTVILMLRKRPAGENAGFKQRLLPAVRAEVKRQIETMMHLNDEVKDKLGEPVFNDSDLQMAGYAAALKVLTSYTHIGGEDVTSFALRPRTKGEVTVVDEIVQQAAEAANSLLVPEGLSADTWQKINGIQRFYLRMMDIETTGASKLDNYQNFAKAFRVEDYGRVMGNMTANKAQLKRIPEFASRDLTDSTEIGSTWLGHLVIGLQQILNEKEPQTVISQLQADLPDFMEVRPILIDMLTFIEKKAPEKATRDAAEVLGARLKNMRALGQ